MVKLKNQESLTAVLVAPGESPKGFARWAETSLRENPDVIFIGVDGGLDVLLKSGLPAGVAIGDWDSLKSKKVLKDVSHVTLKEDKSRSDLFYALEFAYSLGATEVVVYGFQGGRFDHELGVFYDLREASELFEVIRWVGSRAEAYLLQDGEIELGLKKNAPFSVYALSDEARGVTIRNAKYELKNAKLPSSTLGLSNAARGAVKVSVKSGGVMVMSG